LSAWPRLMTGSWSEKLIIPMIHLLALAVYPHALLLFFQARPTIAARMPRRLLRALGAANGQFLLFKRESYERIGGHASVRNHLVEDVALGREIALRIGEGMRLINCDGARFVQCRMYTRFAEVWEGFTKNVRPAFEDSPAVFLAIGWLQLCCFFAPCLFVFFPGSAWRLITSQVVLIYAIRLLLTIRFRTSWWSLLLHPVGHALAMSIAMNSWRKSAGSGVKWKGRIYRVSGE
jgi:chlorobactene glucosyltransferase